MSDNSAVVKIIANHTKEYNALILQHNTLLKVHVKTVEDFGKLDLKAYELRKQNKKLRDMLMRWEKENKILQESLDQCQRELLDSQEGDESPVKLDEWRNL